MATPEALPHVSPERMKHPPLRYRSVCARQHSGVVLLTMLVLLTLLGLSLFIKQLNTTSLRATRTQTEAFTLKEAKENVLGDMASRFSSDAVGDAGYLRLPDLGAGVGGLASEGTASPNFTGNGQDFSVIGKLPWATMHSGPLRDASGECYWYVVSGRFKITPKTDVLNWDTPGQIDIVSSTGDLIASSLAALIVAPGSPLDGQNRQLADAAYTECGGNYDARNYLDTYDNADAVGGAVNYFTGSTNNRVATSTANKIFVLAGNDHYNDRFAFISVDEIFNLVTKRRDFAEAIGKLLDYFKTQNDTAAATSPATTVPGDPPTSGDVIPRVAITGNKGTDSLDCSSAPDPAFCKNWKDMLFLTALPVPVNIMIDGAASEYPCQRVLIFGGRRTASQARLTAAEKADKNNYLEVPNNNSFASPTATASNFAGTSVFDAANPQADIVRCLK